MERDGLSLDLVLDDARTQSKRNYSGPGQAERDTAFDGFAWRHQSEWLAMTLVRTYVAWNLDKKPITSD